MPAPTTASSALNTIGDSVLLAVKTASDTIHQVQAAPVSQDTEKILKFKSIAVTETVHPVTKADAPIALLTATGFYPIEVVCVSET